MRAETNENEVFLFGFAEPNPTFAGSKVGNLFNETATELHSMACPFPDVSQSNWAYGNIMEAAITHKH